MRFCSVQTARFMGAVIAAWGRQGVWNLLQRLRLQNASELEAHRGNQIHRTLQIFRLVGRMCSTCAIHILSIVFAVFKHTAAANYLEKSCAQLASEMSAYRRAEAQRSFFWCDLVDRCDFIAQLSRALAAWAHATAVTAWDRVRGLHVPKVHHNSLVGGMVLRAEATRSLGLLGLVLVAWAHSASKEATERLAMQSAAKLEARCDLLSEELALRSDVVKTAVIKGAIFALWARNVLVIIADRLHFRSASERETHRSAVAQRITRLVELAVRQETVSPTSTLAMTIAAWARASAAERLRTRAVHRLMSHLGSAETASLLNIVMVVWARVVSACMVE